MAQNSKIEWTHHTFNPWIGCTKVSAACDNCYAEVATPTRVKRAAEQETWGPHAARQRTKNWSAPLKWNKALEGTGKRERVFCASLADVFDNHKSIDPQWRVDLWQLIRDTPNLDWLLLTKRPQNIAKMLPDDWNTGYKNVWLGTTVEDQTEADRRIPELLAVPAAVRFLSCEPLLGPVDLNSNLGGTLWIGGQRGCGGTHQHSGRTGDVIHGIKHDCHPNRPHHHHDDRCNKGIDWIITGGESGPHYRATDNAWFCSLRDQCTNADVPFLFKQYGGKSQREIKALGRALDGVMHDGYPEVQ